MKKKIIGVIAAAAALVLLAASVVITGENEYSLIRRFGKVDRIIEHAGITFKIPFMESADKIPNQLLLYDLPESDVITMDKKTMIADSYVLWRVAEPLKFAKSLNSSISNAEQRIDAAVYNATKNVISNMTQNDVIAARDGELQEAVKAGVGTSMDSYGIALETIELKQLDLPEDNKAAVYERMISERGKIAATYQAEGDSEAQKIRNTTDKEVEIMLSDAEAQAAATIAEGEAEYMQILAEAYSDEGKAEFYSFVRSLEAAKASLTGGSNTLILPADSPIAEIFMNQDQTAQ
ncbi:MAG TPA: protease modulator HflC [Firmicutes bacterium]|nr:protease modulator HflC [Bacillota bacterium]